MYKRQDKNLVASDDRVQAVSDAKHSSALELLVDQLLDVLLGNHIDVGSGFIEDDNFVASEDGSDDTDELSFAHAQVLALFLDLEVETFAIILILLVFLLLFVIFLFILIFFLLLFVFLLFIRVRLFRLFIFLQESLSSLLLGLLLFFILEFFLGDAFEKVFESSFLDKLNLALITALIKWVKVVLEIECPT